MAPAGTGKLRVPLAAIVLVIAGCKVKDPPPIEGPWSDDFARDEVGSNYYKTGGGFRVVDGALAVQGAHNKPLWLRKKLPRDVKIELTAWSNSPEGDIKIEVFGDGRSFDPDGNRYMATGYVLVFGGWSNSKSILARMDEHGEVNVDLVERRQPKVEPGRKYRWTITRRGKKVDWQIDGQPFLSFDDLQPLEGPGHEYLGFNNWETDTRFDDLVVTPL